MRAWKGCGKRPMKTVDWDKVPPGEIPACEGCGWSTEFCVCFDDLHFEEEGEEV
jgi:hypothetical protein